MEETTMECLSHINDCSFASPGRFGSSAETGEENGGSKSRAAPRRHGSVFSGHENDAALLGHIFVRRACLRSRYRYTCYRTQQPQSEQICTASP
jgi:hypothetical protein